MRTRILAAVAAAVTLASLSPAAPASAAVPTPQQSPVGALHPLLLGEPAGSTHRANARLQAPVSSSYSGCSLRVAQHRYWAQTVFAADETLAAPVTEASGEQDKFSSAADAGAAVTSVIKANRCYDAKDPDYVYSAAKQPDTTYKGSRLQTFVVRTTEHGDVTVSSVATWLLYKNWLVRVEATRADGTVPTRSAADTRKAATQVLDQLTAQGQAYLGR